MESEIFKIIFNSGSLALVLAILFYYSLTAFKSERSERLELKSDLKSLQIEFHKFKDSVINEFKSALIDNSDNLKHLQEKIDNRLK